MLNTVTKKSATQSCGQNQPGTSIAPDSKGNGTDSDIGWLVGWGLTALSAQIGHIVP